jgi:hypothetical protein
VHHVGFTILIYYDARSTKHEVNGVSEQLHSQIILFNEKETSMSFAQKDYLGPRYAIDALNSPNTIRRHAA